MGINLAAMQAENERLAETPGGGGGFLDNFVMMPEGNGNVVVRILPPQDGRDLPHLGTRVHTINERKVHCRKEFSGNRYQGNCPVCDYYNLLWKEADALDKKGKIDEAERKKAEARMIKPVERYYYNAVVRSGKDSQGNEQKNVGPKILSIGKTLHQRVVRAICGDKSIDEPGIGDVTDLKNGRDFKIIKRMTSSGRDSYPNYDDSKFLEPSPAGTPDQRKQWMENLHDLTELRKVRTVEECEKELAIHMRLEPDTAATGFDRKAFETKFGGKPVAASEDEGVSRRSTVVEEDVEEEETPPPVKPRKNAKPAPVVEDDPDSDDVSDEDKPIDPQKFLAELQNM